MDRSRTFGSRQRRSPTLVIALLLGAVLLVALDRAGMLGDARTQATSLITPALTLTHQLGTLAGDATGRLTSPSEQEQEIATLRQENGDLKAENLRVQELELEVTRLRQQLRIEEEQPWKLVGADIGAFAPDNGRRQILLGVGSKSGVKPGMAVISREGNSPPSLIGIVQEVGPTSASVLLITDFSSAVSGRIYRADRAINGIVQGQWQIGSRLRLEEIAREDLIAKGDVVVTAGLSAELNPDLPRALIPANIPIGIVESIDTDGQTQQAELRPFVDPDRVRYAWVILNAGD